MKTRSLSFLTGCSLVAAGLFALPDGRAQSGGIPLAALRDAPVKMTGTYDKDAKAKGSLLNDLLVYTYDDLGNEVPAKTILIRNNGTKTVYPLMRGVNNTPWPKDKTKGLYDPFDPCNIEYRGYIGYATDPLIPSRKSYNYGLRPNQSIKVRVPLSCWDGGRMHILTESEYLVPTGTIPNVYSYDPKAKVIIADAEARYNNNGINDDVDQKDGVVLWYVSSTAVGPVNESPDQLLEWTFRDKAYFNKIPSKNEIPEGEFVTLANYDVSYVDNLYLPLTMEALDVPLPQPPLRKWQPYGWIGANYTAPELRKKLKKFAADKDNGLGDYFDGKGWPIFNMPDPDDIKIPSGNSVFAESPLADKVSKYDGNWYTLSSGGDTKNPRKVSIGGQGVATSGTLITLSTNKDYVQAIKSLVPDMTVVGHPPGNPPKKNPIAPGTKVVKVNRPKKSTDPTTVVIKPGLQASEEGASFDFFRPVDDYASNAMIKIWYSWVQYYLDHMPASSKVTFSGSVTKENPTLKFGTARSGLIPGMTVTGTGLPNADASKNIGPVVVLSIADDKKSVLLSQLPSVTATGDFTFLPPQPLQASPARKDLFDMTFEKDPADPSRDPLEFSKQVYLLMAAFSQVPKNPDPDVKSPYNIQLMINVTGGNFGFIFNPNKLALSNGGITITSTLRDILKSVLRGVTDFTQYTEYEGTTRVWYPDPSLERGNQSFNVYNLDPYVWFVHVVMGFSGYGFSLDDDSADVGAGNATQLLVTIGDRPKGTPGPTRGTVKTAENPNEWTIQTTYGPVTGIGEWDPTKKRKFPLNFSDASNTTPIVVTSTNHGLTNGAKVYIEGAKGNTAANTPTKGPKANQPWTIANVTVNTFELVGSEGNGTYTGGGSWNQGEMHYITFSGGDIDGVYWRVKGDDAKAGFKGANMEGPGVTASNPIRIVQLGDPTIGQLAISGTLKQANGKVLPAKKNYKWIFSGH